MISQLAHASPSNRCYARKHGHGRAGKNETEVGAAEALLVPRKPLSRGREVTLLRDLGVFRQCLCAITVLQYVRMATASIANKSIRQTSVSWQATYVHSLFN